jgi:hypothetical protein
MPELPFILEDSEEDEEDASDGVHAAGYSSKTSLHFETTSKLRPSPIYRDSQNEEYWAFLKDVPTIQTDLAPPPSRCPSLLSGSTMSSRNSSTISTRSSVWEANDDEKATDGGIGHALETGDGIPLVDRSQPVISTDQYSTCIMPSCMQSNASFLDEADRARHVSQQFVGTLQCNFCIDDQVVFDHTSDRVSLFLSHMVKQHGVIDTQPATQCTIATCSVCTEPFGVNTFYAHLPGCIIREVSRMEHCPNDVEDKQGDVQDHRSVSRRSRSDGFSDMEPLRASVEVDTIDVVGIDNLIESSRCLSLASSQLTESSEEETDWSEEWTSRESSPGVSQIPRRLSPAKRRLVETIMQRFQYTFSQSTRKTAGDSSSDVSQSGNSGWSSNTSTYSTSSSISRKRSLSGSGSNPPNDEDEGNKRRRSSVKPDGSSLVAEVRFACPFYKRNPGRHQTFTSCRDPGFITVARLK